MKGKKRTRDIFRGIRKPVAPPTKVEEDRRVELREREHRKEIERAPRCSGGNGESRGD